MALKKCRQVDSDFPRQKEQTSPPAFPPFLYFTVCIANRLYILENMPNISDKRQSGMFTWLCRIMEGGMAMDIRLIGQKTVLSAYTARPAETAGKGSPAPAASAPSPV